MEFRKRGALMDKVGDTAGNAKAAEEKFVRISKNIIQLQKQAVILYK